MTTATEKKAPKVPKDPTFYRTVTITKVVATLADKSIDFEVGGDITTNQAIKRMQAREEFKTFNKDGGAVISVQPRKEEREITIEDFLKYSKPRTKPEPKAEQVTTDDVKPTK